LVRNISLAYVIWCIWGQKVTFSGWFVL